MLAFVQAGSIAGLLLRHGRSSFVSGTSSSLVQLSQELDGGRRTMMAIQGQDSNKKKKKSTLKKKKDVEKKPIQKLRTAISTPVTVPVILRERVKKEFVEPNIPTGLSLTFLGTGSGQPTAERGTSSILMQYPGGASLFEAGEGTQMQLERSGVAPAQIDNIFVSHLHGDNVWGLPGMIYDINNYRRSARGIPHVYGPVGTRQLLDTIFLATEARLRRSLCLVTEMHTPGKRVWHRMISHTGKRADERNVMPKQIQSKNYAVASIPFPHPRGPMVVTAAPLQHRATSFGYVFQEPEEFLQFHPEIAEALKVPKGPTWNMLESGRAVRWSDNVVFPRQVFTRRRGRKVVLLGDTANSDNIRDAAFGADLLVHEATIKHRPELVGSPLATHSSVQMAANFAASINAKKLILTHFGRTLNPEEEVAKAAEHHHFSGPIEIAKDFLTVHVPKTEMVLPPEPDFHAGSKKGIYEWKKPQ